MIGIGKRQCDGKMSASSSCSNHLVCITPKKTTEGGGAQVRDEGMKKMRKRDTKRSRIKVSRKL